MTSPEKNVLAKPIVLFDGHCNLCINTTTQLRAADTESRLEWVDMHAPGVRERFPRIDWARTEEEIHLIHRDGKVRTGAKAMRDILEILDTPAARAAVIAFDLPGAAPVAEIIYQFVSENRHSMFGRRNTD